MYAQLHTHTYKTYVIFRRKTVSCMQNNHQETFPFSNTIIMIYKQRYSSNLTRHALLNWGNIVNSQTMTSLLLFIVNVGFGLVLGENVAVFRVNLGQVHNEVDDKFLSIALDSNLLAENWKRFDFNNQRLVAMARALSPAYLRLGGTKADEVVFVEKPADQRPYKQITMSGQDWININNFALKTNMSFLFDFNALHRNNRTNSWDPSNAKLLLKFSSSCGYQNVAWELGNEPNSYHHQWNVNITGKRLGKDFYLLKRLLMDSGYNNSLLVGPDINQIGRCGWKSWFDVAWQWFFGAKRECKPVKYLRDVLQTSGHVLDALTLHHYYLDGRKAMLKDFLNPDLLDSLGKEVDAFQSRFPSKDFWFGETSSAYGGGAKGLSDRFVAGFLWLDKLGLSALKGLKVVIRQTLYHGSYALLSEDLLPNPDYWLSVLYKKLVSNRVLKVDVVGNSIKTLRLYAHCSQAGQSITIFAQNMSPQSQEFKISNLMPTVFNQYELTGYPDLTSKQVALNGQVLHFEQQLPPLLPKTVKNFIMKPYSLSFWTIEAPNSVCWIILEILTLFGSILMHRCTIKNTVCANLSLFAFSIYYSKKILFLSQK